MCCVSMRACIQISSTYVAVGACNFSAGEGAGTGGFPELSGSNSSQLFIHSVKAIILEQKDGKQMEKDT